MDFGEVIGYGAPPKPEFWIGSQATGTGFREAHLAFAAADREAVREFFRVAVELGAEVLHEPRVWPEYHDTYYAAFVATRTATTSRPSATGPSRRAIVLVLLSSPVHRRATSGCRLRDLPRAPLRHGPDGGLMTGDFVGGDPQWLGALQPLPQADSPVRMPGPHLLDQ